MSICGHSFLWKTYLDSYSNILDMYRFYSSKSRADKNHNDTVIYIFGHMIALMLH